MKKYLILIGGILLLLLGLIMVVFVMAALQIAGYGKYGY